MTTVGAVMEEMSPATALLDVNLSPNGRLSVPLVVPVVVYCDERLVLSEQQL
jgi:hypothetical protein